MAGLKSIAIKRDGWGFYAGPDFCAGEGWVIGIMWSWHSMANAPGHGWFLKHVSLHLKRPARVRWQMPIRFTRS